MVGGLVELKIDHIIMRLDVTLIQQAAQGKPSILE